MKCEIESSWDFALVQQFRKTHTNGVAETSPNKEIILNTCSAEGISINIHLTQADIETALPKLVDSEK